MSCTLCRKSSGAGAALSYSQIERYLCFEINPIRAAKASGAMGGGQGRGREGTEGNMVSMLLKCVTRFGAHLFLF